MESCGFMAPKLVFACAKVLLGSLSADNCTSDTIFGDTAAIFSLNHSCLFHIANVMSSIPDRSFFSKSIKIAKIELPQKLIDCMSTEYV